MDDQLNTSFESNESFWDTFEEVKDSIEILLAKPEISLCDLIRELVKGLDLLGDFIFDFEINGFSFEMLVAYNDCDNLVRKLLQHNALQMWIEDRHFAAWQFTKIGQRLDGLSVHTKILEITFRADDEPTKESFKAFSEQSKHIYERLSRFDEVAIFKRWLRNIFPKSIQKETPLDSLNDQAFRLYEFMIKKKWVSYDDLIQTDIVTKPSDEACNKAILRLGKQLAGSSYPVSIDHEPRNRRAKIVIASTDK